MRTNNTQRSIRRNVPIRIYRSYPTCRYNPQSAHVVGFSEVPILPILPVATVASGPRTLTPIEWRPNRDLHHDAKADNAALDGDRKWGKNRCVPGPMATSTGPYATRPRTRVLRQDSLAESRGLAGIHLVAV